MTSVRPWRSSLPASDIMLSPRYTEATYNTHAGSLALRYNIEVIPYLAWNSTASLIDISAQLAAGQEKRADAEKVPETVKGDRLPKDGAPGSTTPTSMARLQLTNIGPFAELDLAASAGLEYPAGRQRHGKINHPQGHCDPHGGLRGGPLC